jgi:hypothetical protein
LNEGGNNNDIPTTLFYILPHVDPDGKKNILNTHESSRNDIEYIRTRPGVVSM